jgi:hypothetical protein
MPIEKSAAVHVSFCGAVRNADNSETSACLSIFFPFERVIHNPNKIILQILIAEIPPGLPFHDSPPDFIGSKELPIATEKTVILFIYPVGLRNFPIRTEFTPEIRGRHANSELKGFRRVVSKTKINVVVEHGTSGSEGHATVLIGKRIKTVGTTLGYRERTVNDQPIQEVGHLADPSTDSGPCPAHR